MHPPLIDPTHEHVDKDGFRLRGVHLARIDAFSDVVFGFALTLLVVSLEVPKTYAELHASLRGFVPFAICFMLLMLIWYSHYKFFRRFGTHDLGTITINSLLLFVVLFYVYPLKFLFTMVSYWAMGFSTASFDNIGQLRELMVIYGLGFMAIYLLLAALYWNGYRQRHVLHLNALEQVLTHNYIAGMAGSAMMGVLSCIAAMLLPERMIGLAGWVYVLLSPMHMLVNRYYRPKIRLAAAGSSAAGQAPIGPEAA
jgi:uncharacterized membrane protein